MRPSAGPPLPTGRVTLLFTDIEGSTRLLDALGDRYVELLEAHRRILRSLWAAHRGVEIGTEGDAFFVAFNGAQDAVDVAIAGQRALAAHDWPHRGALRVRMGLHTGWPQIMPGERDYWGADVHVAARVCAAAHGGQVLMTAQTAESVSATLDDLGEWRLKGIEEPRRLMQLIIDGQGVDCFPPPRALDVRPSNLPQPATALVGRGAALDELCQLLSGSARLVSIVGIGGAGKTRLALAVGHSLLEHFRDGVFFADLSGTADPGAVPHVVATAVGAAATAGVALDIAVREHLRNRRLLLIVDNCEHVLDGTAVIAGWLEAAPELRVLATSQAPLRLRGERCVALGSLELPDADLTDPQTLGEVAAVRLFVERACDANPDFQLSRSSAAAVTEICRRLDGIPMAVELAAARCRVLAPDEIARRLREDVLSLGNGSRDAPERQRSLDAAMAWAVDLLGGVEQAVFRRWGVFAGRPSLAQAEAICGADLDALGAVEALVEHSLLRRDDDGHLRMPQSVHAYAQRLLSESGESDAMSRRHAEVMTATAEAQHDAFMLETVKTLGEVAAGRDDLDAALHWAATNDHALHARLAGSMTLPQVNDGTLLALAPHIEAGLAFAGDPSHTRLRLLLADGVVAYVRGDRARERARLEDAVALADALGDDRQRSLVRAMFAKAVTSGDQPDIDALELLGQARAIARPAGLDDLEQLAGDLAGEVHLVAGRLEEAAGVFARITSDGSRRNFAAFSAPMCLPDLAFARGRHGEALEGYVRILRHPNVDAAGINALWAVNDVAVCLLALGEHVRGLRLIGAVEAHASRFDMHGRPGFVTDKLREHVGRARDRLGPAAAEEAMAEGRGMNWDVALGLAMRAPLTARQSVAATS